MKNLTKLSCIMSSILYYQKTRHKSVDVPYSKIAIIFLNFLINEGLISSFVINERFITIFLKYNVDGTPVMSHLQKISTNRRRVFTCLEKLQENRQNYGIFILSTPIGFITHQTAIQNRISGTLLFYVK